MTVESDRADIIELFGRYADIADTKNFDTLPRLVHRDPFAADFESVNGVPRMEVGLDEYVSILSQAFEHFVATHHCITGHVITIDGDTARAHAHVRAEHWLSDGDGGEVSRWLVVGFYDNEAVRTEAGWRFSKVKLTASFQENAHLLATRNRPENTC